MPAFCYESVRKIEISDSVASFDCGHPALNQFLQRFAVVNQKANSAQTYVCCECGTTLVAGFYSLVVGSVEPSAASIRAAKGLAQHPVPVMILARLAIDQKHQNAGLGRVLLKDALLRTVQAAGIAGIGAVLVHAKDDAARAWYLHWGFEPSPTDPYHLFLIMKDLVKLVTS
ncbi:MAG: GNAT family N-acetyltransferase [Desulfuromonadales bacterium]|nr:GNAT family N-acetyltransferase [Desulfuromonadales bacterium]